MTILILTSCIFHYIISLYHIIISYHYIISLYHIIISYHYIISLYHIIISYIIISYHTLQSSIGTTFDVGITTLTDVDAISRIAYDIRDMAESLEQGEWVTGNSA